jgi:hypothetical protein
VSIASKLLSSKHTILQDLSSEEQNLWNAFNNSVIYEFFTGEPDCPPKFQFNWIEPCFLAAHLPPGYVWAKPSRQKAQPAQPPVEPAQPPAPPGQCLQPQALQINLTNNQYWDQAQIISTAQTTKDNQLQVVKHRGEFKMQVSPSKGSGCS